MNDTNDAEKKLRKLRQRLLKGIGDSHPVTYKLMQAVHGPVIEQFAKETGQSAKKLKEQVERERSMRGPHPEPTPEEKHKHEES